MILPVKFDRSDRHGVEAAALDDEIKFCRLKRDVVSRHRKLEDKMAIKKETYEVKIFVSAEPAHRIGKKIEKMEQEGSRYPIEIDGPCRIMFCDGSCSEEPENEEEQKKILQQVYLDGRLNRCMCLYTLRQ
jgi:hypothetical protein